MDKVSKLIISILIINLLGSCSNDNSGSEYELYFIYNPWTKFDFVNNSLKIEYGKFKYSESSILSQSDSTAIMNSFSQNRIHKVEGEVMLANGMIDMPPVDFTILTFRKNILISTITINENYSINKVWPFGECFRILKFRDETLKVLEKNEKFKKALESFSSYQSNEWIKHRR